MTTTMNSSDPATLARAWAAADPDSETRAEIETLLLEGESAVNERFEGRLHFGTAGIRGPIGAGPNRMNRVLVRVVAAAIGSRLAGETDPHVVVGFDARHKSRDFAEDTVRVLAARGVRCVLLNRPLPTPVLAYAVRQLNASAGVMVTASHNPRSDNGYKVYWRGGLQISTPIDREISDLIDEIPLLTEADLAPVDHDAIEVGDDQIVDGYLAAVVGLLDPDIDRTTRCAYTPLHGVGGEVFNKAFLRAGFPVPTTVTSQEMPDPDFPTTPFPNPEEPGVMDQLVELAAEIGVDVAFANDPDADRLAVAVPDGTEWHQLTGDELGCLLAEHLLRRSATDRRRMMISSVVSSRLLARIAAHHGVDHVVTLPGFKWIMQARVERPDNEFVMGYEEALGYAMGDAVWDKDGVSAALVVAEMVSEASASGRTVLDLLDDIHQRHGVFVSGQRSIRFESTGPDDSAMATAMDLLRSQPPREIAGIPVRQVIDLASGTNDLSPTDAVVIELDECRVIVRPSGTEPKMKIYGEVERSVGGDLDGVRSEATAVLDALLDDAVRVITKSD